jgi:hypothetical protein
LGSEAYRHLGCSKLEAAVWICASIALGYYGDGEHDLAYIIRHDSAVHRPALAAAAILAACNAAIFLYVQIGVRLVRGVAENPELEARWAVPSAGCCGVLCASCLVYAFWGIWGWLTPALGAVHLMALVMALGSLPNIGAPKLRKD